MADANTMVKQAIQAYKANDKVKAKDLLLKAVDLDDRNEQAWMWLSAVADSLEDQQICLENVLALNPNNERAQKGLAVVKQKLGQKGDTPSPATPTKTSTQPVEPPVGSNPLAGTGFDSNPFVGGWDALDTPQDSTSDSGSIPTSVDWGQSSGGASAYGSGKQVDQPSGDQYDDWISNLGIGSSGSESGGGASTNPFTSLDWGSPAEGGDTAGAAASSSVAAEDDPWGSLSGGSDPWGSASAPSAASEAPSSDPWSSVPGTGSSGGSSSASSDPWGSVSRESSGESPNPFGSSPSSDPWGSSSASSSGSDAWNSAGSSSGSSAWGSSSDESEDSGSWSSGGFGSADTESSWGSESDSDEWSGESSSPFGSTTSAFTDSDDQVDTYEASDSGYTSSGSFDFDSSSSYEADRSTSSGGFDFEQTFEVSDDDYIFEDSSVDTFDFGADDDLDPFDDDGFDFDSGTSPFAGGSSRSAVSDYHKFIPAEFRTAKSSNTGMILTIFILVLLNAAAIAGLVIA